MVEGLATILGCLDKHLQVLHDLLLTAEVAERQRSQGILKVLLTSIAGIALLMYVEIVVYQGGFLF